MDDPAAQAQPPVVEDPAAQPPVVAAQPPVVEDPAAQAEDVTPLVNWVPVFQRSKASVFLTQFTPVRGQAINARVIAKDAGSKTAEQLDAIFASPWFTETGVSSHMDGDYLYILTTAHIVDHLFHAVNRPIDPATVNQLFTIEVTCFHAERDFTVNRNMGGDRTYTAATVCGIDCLRDLMMLRVGRTELAVRGVGQQRVQCTRQHPVLQFDGARELGMQCMLVSWPPFRPCTFATGLQCLHRVLTGMSTNPVGYDMELLEAYIGSDHGSSGGPLFNAAGWVKGILHGGSGAHSQFILPRDILPFIQNNAVPPQPPSTSSSPPRGPRGGGGGGGPKRGPNKDDKSGPSDPPKRRRSVRDKGKATAAWGSGRWRYTLRSHGKGMAVGAGGSGQKYLLRPRS
ncbi:hypothetical protein CFC21_075496 [Triticum aestivum]|uniref:Peptidase S1 domain-containing protein n=3 Tax=Triticinae TaxID=1648030 RepID=A0A3B6MJP8_WHEAT|nr:uncharacterized protein LOC123125327 [Triticum aestivum]KAF7069927.1 hypothetical protein CFC21_075496 [Triticum aestivum]